MLFESKKDSSIQGKNVRVIEVKLNGSYLVSREFIYQNTDTLFYYNINSKLFYILYNLSAKTGDTITVHSGKFKPTKGFFSYYDSINDFKYKIISIDSVQLSGNWIKRQKVTLLKNGLWGFSKPDNKDYYILNKIGSLVYFFGVQSGFTPEDNLSICRCYSEPNFEFKNPLWNYDCALISAANNNKLIDNNVVYPNPFDAQLNIEMAEPIEFIEIYNINGLKIQYIKQNRESVSINTSSLKTGCYLLKIKTSHHLFSKKLIKQ